jgi:cyclohexanecarboxyl-CoA dehydrogenase
MSYHALALRVAGRSARREAAMCKWLGPKVALEAINDAVVLHGHAGWSNEMPLMQMLLDVSGLQIGDGTPQIQKLIIARDLLGREFTG